MTAWTEAIRAAELFAVDPVGVGGVAVRSRAGPARDQWMAELSELLPVGEPIRRMPVAVADERLLGGLDLAATLAAGRPVAARGLLADAHGGVVVVAMAERLSQGTAARLAMTMDSGTVAAERDGFALRAAARFGVVALDEGDEEEQPPAGLLDRLAFRVDLDEVRPSETARSGGSRDPGEDQGFAVQSARFQLGSVEIAAEMLDALTQAAAALGIGSSRAPLLAARVARAAAALAGRDSVTDEDAAEAARLVLAPRAMLLPPPDSAPQPDPQEAPESGSSSGEAEEDGSAPDQPLADMVLEAAKAAVPADLLARVAANAARVRAKAPGRSGAAEKSAVGGRPAGIREGAPGGGARLDVLATLRAAAPWQRLRDQRQTGRLAIRREDFRIARRVRKARATTIFVVDASGSSALNRLAEAKGAVELLLAECYVRRDQVALVAFRGRSADIVLPPTASLTRARRCLAGLPGGGGTPLASALDAAGALADQVRRREGPAVIVLLTDGRANVARDGTGARERSAAEALDAARELRARGLSSLLIDTSPRPRPAGRALAEAMGAVYLPLPQADASAMFRAAKAAGA